MHNFHGLYLAGLPHVIWTGGTGDGYTMYRIVLTEYDPRSYTYITLAFEASRADDDVDAMAVRRWTPASIEQVNEILTDAYKELLFLDLAEGVDGYR
jgi:hypothetical protein